MASNGYVPIVGTDSGGGRKSTSGDSSFTLSVIDNTNGSHGKKSTQTFKLTMTAIVQMEYYESLGTWNVVLAPNEMPFTTDVQDGFSTTIAANEQFSVKCENNSMYTGQVPAMIVYTYLVESTVGNDKSEGQHVVTRYV